MPILQQRDITHRWQPYSLKARLMAQQPRYYDVLVEVALTEHEVWHTNLSIKGEQVPAQRLLRMLAESAPAGIDSDLLLRGACSLVFQDGSIFRLQPQSRVVYRDWRINPAECAVLQTSYAYVRIDLPEPHCLPLPRLAPAPAQWAALLASPADHCTESEINRWLSPCSCCHRMQDTLDEQFRCVECSADACKCFRMFAQKGWDFATQTVYRSV
jgi:hypothetical protein